jgi:hypothetical protein
MAGEAGYQVASASVFCILSFLDPVECSRRLLSRFARNPTTTAGGGRDEEGWDSISSAKPSEWRARRVSKAQP